MFFLQHRWYNRYQVLILLRKRKSKIPISAKNIKDAVKANISLHLSVSYDGWLVHNGGRVDCAVVVGKVVVPVVCGEEG